MTDEVVVEAAREIKTGKRISLNWELNALKESECPPFFSRRHFDHNIYARAPPAVSIDDIWTFNSQSSTQWDGLRHCGYNTERLFYNGVTEDDILGKGAGTINGVHAMAKEGIVGRGVFLDFYEWNQKTGKYPDFDPFGTHPISAQDLKDIAQAQGVTFRKGDILLYRAGLFEKFDKLHSKDQASITTRKAPFTFAGLEQTKSMMEFLWENHFAALASDQPALEVYPTDFVQDPEVVPNRLHEVLLAGWGCPIGEFFHLEALAEHCKSTGRYTFFLTSEPCNVAGGAAR